VILFYYLSDELNHFQAVANIIIKQYIFSVCEGNRAAVFCANDGDTCNNCELGADRENQRANNNEKVDDQNVCKSCKLICRIFSNFYNKSNS
jgi:hypothetical protein